MATEPGYYLYIRSNKFEDDIHFKILNESIQVFLNNLFKCIRIRNPIELLALELLFTLLYPFRRLVLTDRRTEHFQVALCIMHISIFNDSALLAASENSRSVGIFSNYFMLSHFDIHRSVKRSVKKFKKVF